MHEPKVVIYGLVDPFTNELRYVGQTVNGRQRLSVHIKSLNEKSHKANWIKSVLAKNGKPEWFIIEVVEKHELDEAECFWIAYFRSIGSRLTNATPGGEHPTHTAETKLKISLSKQNISIETRQKLSASLKKSAAVQRHVRFLATSTVVKEKISAAHRGKTLSSEHRKKISIACTGLKRSTETLKKMSAAQMGKVKSAETRAKMSAAKRKVSL